MAWAISAGVGVVDRSADPPASPLGRQPPGARHRPPAARRQPPGVLRRPPARRRPGPAPFPGRRRRGLGLGARRRRPAVRGPVGPGAPRELGLETGGLRPRPPTRAASARRRGLLGDPLPGRGRPDWAAASASRSAVAAMATTQAEAELEAVGSARRSGPRRAAAGGPRRRPGATIAPERRRRRRWPRPRPRPAGRPRAGPEDAPRGGQDRFVSPRAAAELVAGGRRGQAPPVERPQPAGGGGHVRWAAAAAAPRRPSRAGAPAGRRGRRRERLGLVLARSPAAGARGRSSGCLVTPHPAAPSLCPGGAGPYDWAVRPRRALEGSHAGTIRRAHAGDPRRRGDRWTSRPTPRRPSPTTGSPTGSAPCSWPTPPAA